MTSAPNPPASDPFGRAADLDSRQPRERTGEKLGEIRGDRLCLKCGFNLHGQTIVREPHYGMMIARCPECATVSGLQEYPVLGAWAKRWGLILAAIYVIITLGGLLAAGLASGGLAIAVQQETLRDTANRIGNLHRQWFGDTAQEKAIVAAFPSPTPQQQAQISETIDGVRRWGTYGAVQTAWWETHGRAAATAGFVEPGRRPRVQHELILVTTLAGLGAIAAGMVFGVLLAGLRGWKHLAAPAAIIAVGTLLALPVTMMFTAEMHSPRFGSGWLPGYQSTGQFAMLVVSPFLWAQVLGGIAACVAVGCFLGRPVARLLVRVFLPRRSAFALSVLWEADGKRFPGR